jgi:hypothetical protein
MSYGNVPDDWGMYWRTCEICGGRYHASDGGCDCYEYFAELEPCKCGACEWEVETDDDPRWRRNLHWRGSIYCRCCSGKPGSGATPAE